MHLGLWIAVPTDDPRMHVACSTLRCVNTAGYLEINIEFSNTPSRNRTTNNSDDDADVHRIQEAAPFSFSYCTCGGNIQAAIPLNTI